MSIVLDNLNSVLQNVQQQKATMDTARKQAEIIGRTVSADVQAAIDVLVKAFPENPVQVIGRLIGAQLQIASLDKTQVEVDALVAGIQTLVAKEELLSEVAKQMEVNAQPQAPLSNAAGSGELPAANDAAPASSAAVAPQAPADGVQPASGAQGDGASGS